MEEKIHYNKIPLVKGIRTKCGVERRSQTRYRTNFGYATTRNIKEVTCERCLAGLKKKQGGKFFSSQP